MPTIRSKHIYEKHQFFSSRTIAWCHKDTEKTPFIRYIEQYGVSHMLSLHQVFQAEQRLLNIHFMATYINSWSTFVEPWTAWRIIGIEKARSGFLELAQSFQNRDVDQDVTHTTAVFLTDVGLYKSGTLLAEWLLEKRENTLGKEHPSTLISLNNLALLYNNQGRYEEAEPLYIRALEASERTLGKEHPHTLISVNNLAELYNVQGKYEEAEPLFRRALELRERTLGKKHPHTLIFLNNLATLYQNQGKYEEAEPLYIRALEANEQTLGKEHPKTLISRYQLGNVFLELKKLKPSIMYLHETLEGEISLYGKDANELAMTHWNLARAYRLNDDPETASQHRMRCWEIEVQHNDQFEASVLQTAVAYLQDLIAAQKHSIAKQFQASLKKELDTLEYPSKEQKKQIVRIEELDI